MPPHVAVAPAARSQHKPSRPTASADRLRPCRRVEAAVEAEHGGGATHEERTGKTPPSAGKILNCGTGWTRPSSFLRPSNRCSPPRAWAWGSATAKSTTCWRFSGGHGVSQSHDDSSLGQSRGKSRGAVLKRLDRCCRVLVLVGCLDEIFSTADRSWWGSIPRAWCGFWGKKRPITKVRPGLDNRGLDLAALCDLRRGQGTPVGIAQMQQHQRETGQAPLEKGLDVFHTKKESHRVLSILWKPGGAALGTS